MAKAKIALEDQIKTLHKHFTAIVVTVKDLKSSMVALEKKVDAHETKEIENILQSQKHLEDMIKENKQAIQLIDEEFVKVSQVKEVAKEQKKTCKSDTEENRKMKCRYYNRGYCKYKLKCKFSHVRENCAGYLESGKCEAKDCPYRHQKQCKWLSTPIGCRRGVKCEYLHVTLASEEETVSYKCEGCKDIWNDGNCVVGHILNEKRCYFCLNCNDWIRHKANVFNEGWTLLDEAGYLRTNI